MKYVIYTLIVLTLSLQACRRRELRNSPTPVTTVTVSFDWSEASEGRPASMAMILFPLDGDGEPLRYDFSRLEGGTARVPLGRYKGVCFNNDTENLRYDITTSCLSFTITSRSTDLLSPVATLGVRSDHAPRAEGTEGERVVLEPDMLWTDRTDIIDLRKAGSSDCIRFTPRESISKLKFTIDNVANGKYVSSAAAAISGVAGGLLAGEGIPASERVTIPFGMTVVDDDTSLTGAVGMFGHCPDIPGSHKLTVYVLLADGSKWYYTYDITQAFHSFPADCRDITITLDSLPLPKPAMDGSFHPSVEQWDAIGVGIDM